MMIKASIIGAMGYTGLELVRLLKAHPNVEIAYLTSRQHEDIAIGDIYPHLAHLNLRVTNTSPEEVAAGSDIVFLALPHRAAQDTVAELHGKVKIVDLSADFRLDDAPTYEKYYDTKHKHHGLLSEVVYGLPEIIGAEAIAAASTVANPGCFALISQMLLHPFKGSIASADIFAVTGSSGAGKSAVDGTHHPVRNHNIKSYGVNTHRHIPEIIRAGGITEEQLNFVPTSGPFTRGIFAQAFITLEESSPLYNILHNASPRESDVSREGASSGENNVSGEGAEATFGSGEGDASGVGAEATFGSGEGDASGVGAEAASEIAGISLFEKDALTQHIEQSYPSSDASHPFVRIMKNQCVALANVVGSNYVDLSFEIGQDGRILAQGVIDNLVKGAAGCAVQNMNIMFGMDETLGLSSITPLYP